MKYGAKIKWFESIAKNKLPDNLDKSLGLCSNFYAGFDENLELLVNFSEYPHFSGKVSYPIRSTNSLLTAREKYDCTKNLYTHKYGKLRRHFAQWCADELRKS